MDNLKYLEHVVELGKVQAATTPEEMSGAFGAFNGFLGLYYDLAKMELQKPVIVSPDAGGVYRVKKFRDGLMTKYGIDAGVAMIIKQRGKPGQIDSMDLVGTIDDSDCIIVDDMIDTAGTLCKAANQLKEHGGRGVERD